MQSCSSMSFFGLIQVVWSGVSGSRSHLNWALVSALSTIYTVQEQYVCFVGLVTISMGLEMPTWSAILLLYVILWSNSGGRKRCFGGRSQLNWALVSDLSAIYTVLDQYLYLFVLLALHMASRGLSFTEFIPYVVCDVHIYICPNQINWIPLTRGPCCLCFMATIPLFVLLLATSAKWKHSGSLFVC